MSEKYIAGKYVAGGMLVIKGEKKLLLDEVVSELNTLRAKVKRLEREKAEAGTVMKIVDNILAAMHHGIKSPGDTERLLHEARTYLSTLDAPSKPEDLPSWNRRAEPQGRVSKDSVEWVVNNNAELGVKIGGQFFWLYKGGSLVYESGKHDNGLPMYWRHVGKREFGECCSPVHLDRYPEVYREGAGWQPLPEPLKEG